MASTAESTVPCAVMMMTGTSGSAALMARSTSMPPDLRHHQIGDDHVRAVLLELGEPLLAVLGDGDVVAVTAEHRGEHLAEVRLVVDDQDLCHVWRAGHHAGRSARRQEERRDVSERALAWRRP